jgi:hypothetical protein
MDVDPITSRDDRIFTTPISIKYNFDASGPAEMFSMIEREEA